MENLLSTLLQLERAAFGELGVPGPGADAAGTAGLEATNAGHASAAYTPSMVAEVLASPAYRILLYSNGQILSSGTPLDADAQVPPSEGYLIAHRSPPERLEELYRIGVPMAHRRKGIGRRLLLEWTHEASATADRLLLEVGETNLAARRLYESAGFTITGRRRAYYADGSAALIYELRFF